MIDQVLRVEALIAQDADADLVGLHRRDRAIGRRLAAPARRPSLRVLQWAGLREEPVPLGIANVARAEHTALALVVALGLMLGAGAAAGVLWYDGSGRVNVLAALALLVGLQVLAAILSVVLMLPPAWRAALPGLGALQSALEAFSPGRLQRLVARWAPQQLREKVALIVAHARAGERVYGRLRRWLALLTGQAFGVAFNLGLVAAYLAAVVFTDLAFGWSTTLEVEPARLQTLLATLASPWAAWLPDAVPTPELVEVSRHFRSAGAAAVDPALLGRWWPFMLMCVLTYGAVPRLVLLTLAVIRVRAALAWTLVHLPGARELLYRLDHDAVETRAETPEAPRGPMPDPAPGTLASSAHGPATIIVWADLEVDEPTLAAALTRAAALAPVRTLRAGAGTLEADAETIATAAAVDEPVALVVKSWEPPLGELVDFLAELRAAVGAARPVSVVPLATAPCAAPARADVETWRTRLARTGDPWLAVREVPA
jgi:hypothetical protein